MSTSLTCLVNGYQNGKLDRKSRAISVIDFIESPQKFLFFGLSYSVQRFCISHFLARRETSYISLTVVKVFYSNCSFTIPVSIGRFHYVNVLPDSLFSSVLASEHFSPKESSWVARSVFKILEMTPTLCFS